MTDLNSDDDLADAATVQSVEPQSTAPTTFQAGQIIGTNYQVLSQLGSGGMGTVYRVHHLFLNKEFALKTLNKRNLSERSIRRFHQEARAAGSLNHSNLVKITDFGLLEDQRPYLVMELASGIALSKHIKKNGPLDYELAILVLLQACRGLAFAHSKGVIHRDIKPSNIILNSTDALDVLPDDSVKVIDFGIAKLTDHEGGEIQALTQTGEIFGSPFYMSPEQASGQPVDHRTDIYSLGCVLFDALTGSPPFRGESALKTMMLHQSQRPPTLREAAPDREFPEELESLVSKMLEKRPADRPQNIKEVESDLMYLSGIISGSQSSISTLSPEGSNEGKKFAPVPDSRLRIEPILLGTLIGVIGLGLIAGANSLKVAQEQPISITPKNEIQLSMIFEEKGAISTNSLPFSRLDKTKDGRLVRHFHLPPNFCFIPGFVDTDKRKIPIKKIDFDLEENESIALFCYDLLDPPTNLLSGLEPESVHQLSCANNFNIIDKHISGLAGWTRLAQLDLSGTSVTDDSIKHLSTLPALAELDIGLTNISGPGLCELPQLLHLRQLNCRRLIGSSILLEKLRNDKRLNRLALSDCNLTDADLSVIATCPNLVSLSIDKNDKITDEGLANLSPLTKLVSLDLGQCHLSRDCARSLTKLRSLKNVTMTITDWSKDDQVSFIKDIAKCQLLNGDSASVQLRMDLNSPYAGDIEPPLSVH